MNAVTHIRKTVLGVSQAVLGTIAGATQATVSRWESGESSPELTQLGRIRDEVKRRELDWDDAWFFDVPVSADCEALREAPPSGLPAISPTGGEIGSVREAAE